MFIFHTGGVQLKEVGRFKTRDAVDAVCVCRGELVACGRLVSYWGPSDWADVYSEAGKLTAELELPERCLPRDVLVIGSKLVLADGGNDCLQVGLGQTNIERMEI